MMKKIFLKYWCFLFFLISGTIFSQDVVKNFEKEKTYLQTNHVFYKPGDEVFYKVLVVDGKDNTPTFKSNIVRVEWIQPSGEIAKTLYHKIIDGYATGNINLPENIVGGIYKLRVYTNWMKNEADKNYFEKEVQVQKFVAPRILMKIDFPKKGYGSGDEVIAEFSARSIQDMPINFYVAKYDVFVEGKEVIKNEIFTTDKDGKFTLKFKLPNNLTSTDALLNIKMVYDGFDESISKNIPINLNNIDLRFFPEGGSLVNGFASNLAFKATDHLGKPVDVKGFIYDETHQKVANFSSYRFGMGDVLFKPLNGKKYFAKIEEPKNAQVFEIPKALNNGIILNIENPTQQPQLILYSSEEKKIQLYGSTHEVTYLEKELILSKGENKIPIDFSVFPQGIAKFTIVADGIPQAERVVFLNANKKLHINVTSNKKYYLPRDIVVLTVSTKDENNNPVPANLALSVVDDKLWTFTDDKQDNLVSWLLMSSELKGKIEEPNFYFKEDEKQAPKSLDLLMLTHGYRFFELLPDVLNTNKLKFLPEKSNGIFGVVIDQNEEPVEAEVFLVENTSGVNGKIAAQTTTKNGQFYFSNINNSRNNKLIAKSTKPKTKIQIKLLSYDLDVNPFGDAKSNSNIDVQEIIKENLKDKYDWVTKKNTNQPSRNSGRDTINKIEEIREVVILGYNKTVIKAKDVTASTVVSSNTLESMPTSVFLNTLQGEAPGLSVSTTSGQPGSAKLDVVIRGVSSLSASSDPLYVIDGIISNTVQFRNLNPNELKSVSVLKDAAATAIYGNRGSNGVIVISTKSGLGLKRGNVDFDVSGEKYYATAEIPNDKLKQFSWSRTFSYPVYRTTVTKYRHDFRDNIYWNPVVQTDKEGKAVLTFNNSDANTTFRIITEGVGYNGLIGRKEETYVAQSKIASDSKIPPYLTMGDKPIIPLVIKNNDNQTREIKLLPIVPRNVTLQKFDSIKVLKSLESTRMLIGLQTGKMVNSDINFVVNADDEIETLILPFKVEEKGFYHKNSITDFKSRDIAFNLPEDNIEGTFSASLSVYNDVATKMFQDVDRLLREPHGCFEQLSSTVYPNIFILNYLSNSNKLTNSQKEEAEKRLKQGYKKLSKYEQNDGGFGYFSSSSSNIPISAMALLEFTDLQKYVKVKVGLTNRIKQFILSQKNGRGTFNGINYTAKYYWNDEYGWSQQAYTLYALAKSGLSAEIYQEYEVSKKRVLHTKDSYQLAVLANTAFYMKQNEDYQTFLSIIKDQILQNNLTLNAGMSGSSGKSLSAETLALYLLASMKDANADTNHLTDVVSKLSTTFGRYGYGSTQGTVLVLEALSEFYVKNKIIINSAKDEFTFNGINLQEKLKNNYSLDITEMLKKENNFKAYNSEGNTSPYILSWNYSTFNPPKNQKYEIALNTKLSQKSVKIGEINRLKVDVSNTLNYNIPMVVAKIGIPAGLTLDPKLLKDLLEKKQFSYYEIFDNYLVLYWETMKPNEKVTINLDLKAEFPGSYSGKASSAYLYYNPESVFWTAGESVEVVENTKN